MIIRGIVMAFIVNSIRYRVLVGSLRPIYHVAARSPMRPCVYRSFSKIFMSVGDEDELDLSTKSIETPWNVAGLKKETQRLALRCHKKVGKASQRVRKAMQLVEDLTADENASLEDLEKCPDVDALEEDLNELKQRLRKLNKLEEELSSEPKGTRILPENIAELVLDLGVSDTPPQPQPRGTKKPKGPRSSQSTRRPYRRYYSQDVEIRVGKQAEDNDQLTLSPEHRDGSDWWMHASGCPGSHVVIRSSSIDEQVVQDAAALAARQSKCQGSVIKVSLTRCRDIKKPPGAKAGLVQLTGNVRTVAVNMKEAQERLKRLDETCLVN